MFSWIYAANTISSYRNWGKQALDQDTFTGIRLTTGAGWGEGPVGDRKGEAWLSEVQWDCFVHGEIQFCSGTRCNSQSREMNAAKSRYIFYHLLPEVCTPQDISPHSITGLKAVLLFPALWYILLLLLTQFIGCFVCLFGVYFYWWCWDIFFLWGQHFCTLNNPVTIWHVVLKGRRKASQRPRAHLYVQIECYSDYKIRNRRRPTSF